MARRHDLGFGGRVLRAGLASLLVAALAACGDDDETPSGNPGDGGTLDGAINTLDSGVPSNVDSGAQDSGITAPPANALYAIGTWVTAGTVTTASIKTVPRLDVDQKVNLTDTITTGGYGDLYVMNGKAYVSNGEAPTVTRYAISADGKFSAPEGVINFQSKSNAAHIYKQGFISETKAYLTGTTSWIVWNPSTLQIIKEIPFPSSIGVRGENLQPFYSFDRGFVTRGNRAFQTVNWYDLNNYNFLPTSAIVVLDTDNDTVVTVLDNVPCPTLDLLSEDESGNIYASPWVFNPGYTVAKNSGVKSCAVRIPAGSEQVDPNWKLTFADVTGGHEAAAMRYAGNGKFLLAVFHEEKDPYQAGEDIQKWLAQELWTYGQYDVNTKAFAEVPALGNHSGAYNAVLLSGQFFLLTSLTQSATTVFQQLLPDLTVKKGITIDGWSSRAYQVK